MTIIIHGLVSGLVWTAILGTFVIAMAAVVIAVGSASPIAGATGAGVDPGGARSRIPGEQTLGSLGPFADSTPGRSPPSSATDPDPCLFWDNMPPAGMVRRSIRGLSR